LSVKLKSILSVFLALISGTAFAQSLEPGEWQFDAVTTSPLFPGGQTSTFTRCIRKEDAENPERWMARQSETGECNLTPGAKTRTSMAWTMSCPKANMTGEGIARLTAPGTVESEMKMSSELRGYRVEMKTRATGRRLGPCKS